MDYKNNSSKTNKHGKGSSYEQHKEKMGHHKNGQMPKSEKFGKSGSESRSESRGEYNHSPYEEEE